MDIQNKALVLDLVEWVASHPRTYAEVMDAWRTSCPRLSIWEDTSALGFVVCASRGKWEDTSALGFVVCASRGKSEVIVEVTPVGRAFLEAERPRCT